MNGQGVSREGSATLLDRAATKSFDASLCAAVQRVQSKTGMNLGSPGGV